MRFGKVLCPHGAPKVGQDSESLAGYKMLRTEPLILSRPQFSAHESWAAALA